MPSNVIPRHGGFAARVTIAGLQVWLGTFPTREAAQAAVQRARTGRLPSTTTVREWDATWMDIFPGSRNAETAAHNRRMTAAFVGAYGSRRVVSITPLEAQRWAVRSPGSVRYLRLMFSKAARAGIVETNVWVGVETETRRKVQRVPSVSDVQRLVDTARARGGHGLHLADLVVFTAYSGLRCSEVAGMQASDVLDGHRVLVRGKRRAGEIEPRERIVAVFGPGREALARQVPEVGRVWRSAQGRPLTQGSIGRVYRALCDDAGVQGSFHALRRFYATWLRDRGADARDIAMALGHVDAFGRPHPELVDRIYAHPSAEAALQRLEAVTG